MPKYIKYSAMHELDIEVVDRIIRQRKTTKVMLPVVQRQAVEHAWTTQHQSDLSLMIEGAAWAPFHRKAQASLHQVGDRPSVLPWRFHVIAGKSCSGLLQLLQRQAEANPSTKWSRAWQSRIRDMLTACGALIQVTWLPDLNENSNEPELTIGNMEHIAAASAAVQNVLLASEARGWLSYWSSGGILRDHDVFDFLGIQRTEVLLGSLFLSSGAFENARKVEGGLRDQRGEMSDWVKWVRL